VLASIYRAAPLLGNSMTDHTTPSIAGILKVQPVDQRLYNQDNDVMEDDSTLQDYGVTVSTAKAQAPAQLGLTFR